MISKTCTPSTSSPIRSPPPPPPPSSSKDPERLLPIANVSRLMKKTLPTNAKISKEAKETVQECVSEFISFITCEASDKCLREKRKTINGDDLIWAMTSLGFENFVVPLKIYLSKFRELEQEKSNGANEHHQQEHEFDYMDGDLGVENVVNFDVNGYDDNGSVVFNDGLQW